MPFFAGDTGVFSAGNRVGCVPTWILVMRTLGRRTWYRCYFGGSCRLRFPAQCPLFPARPHGSAPGGAVGASDGMVAKVLSFGGRVLRRPRNDPFGTKEP